MGAQHGCAGQGGCDHRRGAGIGQEFARTLAAGGARVVAADISDWVKRWPWSRMRVRRGLAVKLDVTDPASAQAMVEATVQAFGRLDGLINNAALYGALHGGRFDQIDDGEWDAAMAVNVKGIWNCCKAAVPAMRKAGGGSIVKSRRSPRPTACLMGCTTRHRKRR